MNKIAALCVFWALVFVSCTTTVPNVNYKYPHDGVSNNAVLAIKDYQPVEIIFVKSTEIYDGEGNHTGSKITYEMLMAEAKRLGASDVINIKIDVNMVEEVADDFTTKTTINYTASALAIKYTNAIQGDNRINIVQNLGKDTIIDENEQMQIPASIRKRGAGVLW